METTALKDALTGNWTIDNAHSGIQFTIDHLVISQVSGTFSDFSGRIQNEGNGFENSQIEFEIDVQSISTGNQMRDDHLKSDDFFNAGEYPKIRFASTSISRLDDNKYEIHGNMTIRDITKEVIFKTRLGGIAKDGYGNIKLGIKASSTINRFDYRLKWNQLTEAGGVTVGKDVDITANLQFALN